MIKLKMSYGNEEEKLKVQEMINVLSNIATIKKSSDEYKRGNFKQQYVTFKC